MTKNIFEKVEFLLSVANLSQLPPDKGWEVAIVGRSNAGKSSVLNQLTGNKQLARTSKTPGRTQLINLFTIDKNRRMADLPGYGYAKVPPKIKQHWEHLIDAYLSERHSLRGLIVVMDIRHPFKEVDKRLLAWAAQSQLPVHVLLNKVDKLSTQESKKTLQEVHSLIGIYPNNITYQVFSALTGIGIKEFRKKLEEWFAPKESSRSDSIY